MSWWLPPATSTFAGDIDFMFTLILVITGIALVIVETGLIWFVIRYRGRPGRRAFYTHGSTKAEVVWSAIPAVTMVILGIMSNGVWNKIKGRESVPAGAYPIGVHAKQFEWQITYPGPDGQLGTADDFTVRNQLHVPVERPIVTHLSAEDVIHSFFIPEFRLKQDAVPGMDIRVWFEATKADSLELGCAELCGMGHYRMRARVWVWPAEKYDACAKQTADEFVDCLRPSQDQALTGGTGS
ncbi:MAG: cytochrome c oxidase subunit II [Gemmatimonadales bacterium]